MSVGVIKTISVLFSLPLMLLKALTGWRKNCFDLEYLCEFNRMNDTGFKWPELKEFLYRCEQFRKNGEDITAHYLKTPEEKAACQRDWEKLIEAAQLQKEKEQRSSSSPMGYFSARAIGSNINLLDLMIKRFDEQLRAVKACQIERTEIEVSDHLSRDKWVITHKNEEPICVSFQYWMNEGKDKEEPNMYFYYEYSPEREKIMHCSSKSSVLREAGGETLREIELKASPLHHLKLEAVYEDGRAEAIPLP